MISRLPDENRVARALFTPRSVALDRAVSQCALPNRLLFRSGTHSGVVGQWTLVAVRLEDLPPKTSHRQLRSATWTAHAHLDRIRSLALFSGIPAPVFSTVVLGATVQTFPARATLVREGDTVDLLYVLLDGNVELGASWCERDTTVAVLQPVSTFMLAAVVLETEALLSARTLARSEILMLSGQSLRRAMNEDVAFGVAVVRELAGSYQSMVRAIKNQKLRGGLARLANYLLAQQARTGGTAAFTLPHEKRILAALLGMTPENLSRTFARLADYGVVLTGPLVNIAQPTWLHRLAQPDPVADNRKRRAHEAKLTESWTR